MLLLEATLALLAARCWKRRQRTVSGASTEMSRKKGRRISTSRTASVGMSVVTKRLRHRLVTKSSRASADEKLWLWACGRSASDVSEPDCVPFLVVRAVELRAPVKALSGDICSPDEAALSDDPDSGRRCRRLKPWCSTRYCATVFLPEQMPSWGCQHARGGTIAVDGIRTAAYADEHFACILSGQTSWCVDGPTREIEGFIKGGG